MTATFRIFIPLALLVYLSTIMAPYAGVAGTSCATIEMTGMCRCAIETRAHLVCYCQHMNHKGNIGPGVIDSFRSVQDSVKPTVLAGYCSCGDARTPALPGLEKFDHLRSRFYHDVMRDETYVRVPCDPLLHSRAVEPPEPPPQ